MSKIAFIFGAMSLVSVCSMTAEGSDDLIGGGGDGEGTPTIAPEPVTEQPEIDPEFVESEDEVAGEDDESEAEEVVEEDVDSPVTTEAGDDAED